jgi:hypothetical protein
MCNLYSMTASVDEMKRLFGSFEGERDNLPPFDEIYPGKPRRCCAGRMGAGSSSRSWNGAFRGPPPPRAGRSPTSATSPARSGAAR